MNKQDFTKHSYIGYYYPKCVKGKIEEIGSVNFFLFYYFDKGVCDMDSFYLNEQWFEVDFYKNEEFII